MSSSDSPSSSSSSSPSSSDSQFERWRKNLSWITGLGLTPEEEQTRQRDLGKKLDESLIRRCEKMKLSLVETSASIVVLHVDDKELIYVAGPAVLFMLKHLRLSGCPVSPQHIQCVSSEPTEAGGFSTDTGNIFICTRGFSTRKHLENIMVHELVHMYDHCKFKVDWSNLRHHACSEVRSSVQLSDAESFCADGTCIYSVWQIRANSLSGDCRWAREINRLNFTFSKQHQVLLMFYPLLTSLSFTVWIRCVRAGELLYRLLKTWTVPMKPLLSG